MRTGILVLSLCGLLMNSADAAPLYFNGFETDTASWTNATRVASGTNGITSSSGSFHAVSSTTAFTQFGGYNFGAGGGVGVPFQEYTTSIDIYLDVNAGLGNDTRFDFTSAISNAAGDHRRDFIFNAGFYNDATGPGANTNRFVISASNNTQRGNAFAKNPDKGPIAISTTGWYTFQHHFYNNGGVLEVGMSIYDSLSNLVKTWTLSDPTDLIGSNVGGSRYGWFDLNEVTNLAFDNSSLTLAAVPEPSSMVLLGLGGFTLVCGGLRRRRREAAKP